MNAGLGDRPRGDRQRPAPGFGETEDEDDLLYREVVVQGHGDDEGDDLRHGQAPLPRAGAAGGDKDGVDQRGVRVAAVRVEVCWVGVCPRLGGGGSVG